MSRRNIVKMGLIAAVSVLWLVIKTGQKPSRIAYPCQRAALANLNLFLLTFLVPILDLKCLKAFLPHALSLKTTKVAILVCSLLIVVGCTTLTSSYSPSMDNYLPVNLDLRTQTATSSADTSSVFIVGNASGTNGNMDAAVSTLLSAMANQSLIFFKSAAQPAGLIAKDDVVLIKVNAVGPERSGTNTDLVKSLILRILGHPEGFTGEIVIADNGQYTGGLDLAESNAYNHSQSMQAVANQFPTRKVSAVSWYAFAGKQVLEYNQGNLADGFVVNSTQNSITHLQVSYPKFKTRYGTYISFKNGIWNTTTSSYNSGRLKIINVPLLKSHYNYGVTACVKNYMGVTSQTLTGSHSKIPNGGLGTEMAETRFPTLTILDCIWINANPKESGSNCGPPTSYEAASYANTIGASQDPVALEYWAAKHVLIPAAIQKGYTSYSSLDPDYAPIVSGLQDSYHDYLEKTMIQLKSADHQVTMSENQMNVYVTRPSLSFTDDFEYGKFARWSGTRISSGETAAITGTVWHHGKYSARFTTNGGGGTEYAYCYKTIPSSNDLYARGYFYSSKSGIIDENDCFYVLGVFSGSNSLVYAGWKKTSGTVKWCLMMRNGTSAVYIYSSAFACSLNRWYCVEVHWKKGITNGLAEMWVNGVAVCSGTNRNTAAYGDANTVGFGQTKTNYCSNTTFYVDCAELAPNYISPEPLFQDSFESGSFSSWSGTSMSSWGIETTATVVDALSRDGTHSARFNTTGAHPDPEWAYCYRNVVASSDLYARGYFYVSKSGLLNDTSRFYLVRFATSGRTSLAYVGWTKVNGVTKWFLMLRNGTSWVTAHSVATPALDRWYTVQLHWYRGLTSGKAELMVDGKRICLISGVNTSFYGSVSRVEFGIPNAINCGVNLAFCDGCAISNMRI